MLPTYQARALRRGSSTRCNLTSYSSGPESTYESLEIKITHIVGVVEEVVRVGEGGGISTQLLSSEDREGDTK
jgi:hypothetical protein